VALVAAAIVRVHGLALAQQMEVRPPDLPLPAELGENPTSVGDYQNPLLLFKEQPLPLQHLENVDDGSMPSLIPPLPSEPEGLEWPGAPASSEDAQPERQRLLELALRIAPAVVSVRVWDEFGSLLASGAGCFVSSDGMILTDSGLVSPEIAGRIDYITTTAADGKSYGIKGYYVSDLRTGVTLLQSERAATTSLRLLQGMKFEKPLDCHVVAVSEKRGLVLADATLERDSSLAGQGWLNLRGDDSPGAVGSPVIDSQGQVVAVVGLKVPLKNWMNFALPCDMAAFEIGRKRPALKPVSDLPSSPKLADVVENRLFLEAFGNLQNNQMESAALKWLRLTGLFPRSAECWALLGLCASQLGATDEAVNCQRKAVALDPKAGLYWHQLAMEKIRVAEKDVDRHRAEQREILQNALEQRPADKLAWLLLASRCLKDGDYGEADRALRQVTKLEPDYATGFYLLAYVRGRMRDYTGAGHAVARALELNPRSAEAWYYQGLLLDKKRDYNKAAESFSNAVRYRATHPQAWLNLAYALKNAGKPSEARNAFREHQRVTNASGLAKKSS
jgi:tetratricopeptide (TPR) repeat protein